MQTDSLWTRLLEEIDGKKICLGYDLHPEISEKWDFYPDQRPFDERITDVFDDEYMVAIKAQSAFFEGFCVEGAVDLSELLKTAYQKDIPLILDAKRGDIGSTMRGYCEAYLDSDSDFCADALTVSPYLGVEGLLETATYARNSGRGIFILCLTSNPEAYDLQHAIIGTGKNKGKSVAKSIFDFAYDFNDEFGITVGLVVGATIGDGGKTAGIDFSEFNGPILAPGIGAQGATSADLDTVFGDARCKVIPSVSRAILNAGPDPDDMRLKGIEIAKSMGIGGR